MNHYHDLNPQAERRIHELALSKNDTKVYGEPAFSIP
jgi:hypothetical protein